MIDISFSAPVSARAFFFSRSYQPGLAASHSLEIAPGPAYHISPWRFGAKTLPEGGEGANMDSILDGLTGDLSLAGSGNFTLDLQAAGRKKAALARQEPALMLGRLIQTAVALEARDIRFMVGGDSVEARISLTTLREDPVAQDYLQSAMVLAAALEPSELTWTPRDALAVFHFRDKKIGFWAALRQGLWQRERYHSWLRERSRFCPIPVYLDSCRLNSPGPSGAATIHLIQLSGASTSARQRLIVPCPRALDAGTTHLAGQTYQGEMAFGNGRATVWLDGVSRASVLHRSPGFRPRESYATGDYPTAPSLPEPNHGLTLTNRVQAKDGIGYEVGEQWDWSDAGQYLSTATTPSGQLHFVSASSWASCDPTASDRLLWPVRDGLLLDPVEIPTLPMGTRLIATVPTLTLDLEGRRVVVDEACRELAEAVSQRLRAIRG